MKNTSRVLALAIALLMLLGIAVAEARPVAEDTSAYNELGTYSPVANEKFTLRVLMPLPPASVTDIQTNAFTVMLEEMTGVHLQFEQVTEGDTFNDVRNLMFASDDLPDILINSGLSNAEIANYGSQNMFIPLNYYIENCMPAYRAYLDEFIGYDTALSQMTCADGNIYGVNVVYSQAYHNHVGGYKCFVYKPWLEKLGLENPRTTDEFYDMLVAFRDKDPNGNGLRDEKPLIASYKSMRSFLVNAFCYDSATNTHLWVDDGEVKCAYTSDEYREALKYLNLLYRENLIDSTTFTVKDSNVKELTMAPGGNTVGVTMSNAMTGISTADTEQFTGFTNVLEPLTGPEGVSYCVWNYEQYDANVLLITKNCKYPELVCRWYDAFFADVRIPLACAEGIEGKNWELCTNGEIGINGEPAVWQRLSSYATTTAVNHCWESRPFNNIYNHSTQASKVGAQAYELYKATTKYEPHKVPFENYMPTKLWLDAATSAKCVAYATDIASFLDESYTFFVQGVYDVHDDEKWNWYLNELEVIGLSDYLSIQQEAYDAMK